MRHEPFFSPRELSSLKDLFTQRVPDEVVQFITALLERLSTILGIELGGSIPDALLDVPRSSWKAIAVLNRMKRLGIVEEIFTEAPQYPDEPHVHYLHVSLPEQHELGIGGTAVDLLDASNVYWPAVGEALERWALVTFKPPTRDVIDASYSELRKNKVNIFSFAGFSDKVRRTPHPHHALSFDEHSRFRWVKGRSLTDDADIYIPLQLFSFSHLAKEGRSEALLSPVITTGAAVGETLEQTIVNGLLEIVERDAFMIYWLNQIPPNTISLGSIEDGRVKRMLTIAKRYNLEPHLLYLRTDVPAHTVCAVVLDRTGAGPAVCVAAHSGFDLEDVIYKALTESMGHRANKRRMMENAGKQKLSSISSLNHRERILYWCHKDKIPDIEPWLHGQSKRINDLPVYASLEDVRTQLEYLLRFFKTGNYEVVYQDIRNNEIKKALPELFALKVVVPAFQPVHLEESMPCFAGERLKEVPRHLHLPARKNMHRDPHPFP